MNDKKLFSIGEMAKTIGITRKIILNYEAKGLIKPDKKEGSSGNRYYTIDTFTQIRAIRMFQDLGLSLDEICAYFNESANLHPVIERLENMCDKLNLTIEKLKERTLTSNDTIQTINIEPQTVYRRTYESETVAEKTKHLRNTALEAIRMYGTDITRRMYFTEYFNDFPNLVNYCVAIPPDSEGENVKKIPMLKAITLFHHGAYEEIPTVRKRLVEYADENKLELSGAFCNIYIEGPPQHHDKSKFITQVIAILK